MVLMNVGHGHRYGSIQERQPVRAGDFERQVEVSARSAEPQHGSEGNGGRRKDGLEGKLAVVTVSVKFWMHGPALKFFKEACDTPNGGPGKAMIMSANAFMMAALRSYMQPPTTASVHRT